jgi:hypothetical protein
MLRKEGVSPSVANISLLANQLQKDPVRRWKFAPFMIGEMWDAILTESNPVPGLSKKATPAQAAFRAAFERWAACDDTKIARLTLAAWNNYTGKSRSLDGEQWFGTLPPYQQNGLIIPRKRTTQGFLPLENPLFLGENGREAIQMLTRPLQAQISEDPLDYENLKALDDEMARLFEKIGFGVTGGIAVVALAGTPIVRAHYLKAIQTATAKAQIAANDAVNLAAAADEFKAAVQVPTVKEWSKIAPHFKESLRKELFGQSLARILGKVKGKPLTEAAKKLVTFLGPKLVAALAIAGAIATVIDLAVAIIEAIKTEDYEAELKRASNSVDLGFSVTKILYVNEDGYWQEPDDLGKSKLLMQLMKMTIGDPSDLGRLRLEFPQVQCDPGMKNATRTVCAWDVKFFSRNSLTMDQARAIAASNGWDLATEADIKAAWYGLDLDVYAFGRMADGRFAVPVQSDHSNFKTGPNIGATGGNQGFFYTLEKAKRSILKEKASLPKIP